MGYPKELALETLRAIMKLWEIETQDETGRRNLLGGVLVLIAVIAGSAKSIVSEIVRLVLGRPEPWYSYVLPLSLTALLVFYLLISITIVPQKPPQ